MISRWLTWVLAAEAAALVAGGGVLAWRHFGPGAGTAQVSAPQGASAKPAGQQAAPTAAVEQAPLRTGGTAASDAAGPPEHGLAGREDGVTSAGPGTAARGSGSAEAGRRPALRRLERPRILVEKAAGRLSVYDGPTLVRTYAAIVGENRGDKVREGDMRTPEGEFYVCLRKASPATPHVRSLGLSYPGPEDAERGLREGWIDAAQHAAILAAIERGVRPPWDTSLGGAIMIHGSKNDRDGTEGCIALDDEDILDLYPRIPLGTPVRIVP